MKIRLSCVRLLVDTFDECFRFYKETLGGEVVWGQPGEAYAEFRFAGGTTTLALFRRELNTAALNLEGQTAAGPRVDRVSLILEVDDVHAWARTLEGKGQKALAAPTDRNEWGVRTVHFRDPDGNLIELNQPLPR